MNHFLALHVKLTIILILTTIITAIPAFSQDKSQLNLQNESGVVLPFRQVEIPLEKKSCLDTLLILSLNRNGSYMVPYNNISESKLVPTIFQKKGQDEFSLTFNGVDCSVTVSVKIE